MQEQNSVYNVYDWEHDRKQKIKMVKNICYYPPSIIKKRGLKKNRRGSGFESAKNQPNRQLYDLYQQSLRMSVDPLSEANPSMGAAPVSGTDSEMKMRVMTGGPPGQSQSTDLGSTHLPDVHPNSSKNGNITSAGYQTHQTVGNDSMPRFGAGGSKRVGTVNHETARIKGGQLLPPAAPRTR